MFDSALTRLVAVNSIYFKGLWKSRFQAQNTKPRSFTAGDGKTYKVPMMSQLSVFNMGEMVWFSCRFHQILNSHTQNWKIFPTTWFMPLTVWIRVELFSRDDDAIKTWLFFKSLGTLEYFNFTVPHNPGDGNKRVQNVN